MTLTSETDQNTAQLLRCAADHIDRVGLAKDEYFKPPGLDPDFWTDVHMAPANILRMGHEEFKDVPCCAFGALYACALTEDQVDVAGDAVVRYARNNGYRSMGMLNDWNDVPHRRKSDVVRLFRRAADDLDPA